jgi:hypothetical protein
MPASGGIVTKKKVYKQEERCFSELSERMKRSSKTEVRIPILADDLKLGNLRKLLAEYSDKFDEDSTVYIEDNYVTSKSIVTVLYADENYAYSNPRFVLTITSTKEII